MRRSTQPATRDRAHAAEATHEDHERPEPSADLVLRAQRSAGNQAVSRLLQRAVFKPGKKKGTIKLTKHSEVVDAVFEVGKQQALELEALLTDPDAAAALDELLKDALDEKEKKNDITLNSDSDSKRLLERIRTDADKRRAAREQEAKKKDDEPVISPGKHEQETAPSKQLRIQPVIDRGPLNGLFALCEPLYEKHPSTIQKQGNAIRVELNRLKKNARMLAPLECLMMIGHLGNLEITTVCKTAGVSDVLKQLDTLLRKVIQGEEDTPDPFIFKQLAMVLPWLTFEQFMTIYEQRSGSSGATKTSMNITPTNVMHKFSEIIACADMINVISVTGSKCLSTIGVMCPAKDIGFTLLHKMAAGNIRRFKMETIQRCVLRFLTLCPLLVAHERLSPLAVKGLKQSVTKVLAEMNSKHLLRDLRQMEMLLAYLGIHPDALCLNYAFSGIGWEFDILMVDAGETFVLEVEGVPAKKTPQKMVKYIRERHKLKQDEADKALPDKVKVRLALPADVPKEVLDELGPIVAISGAPKGDTPVIGESKDDEDDDSAD